VFTPASVYWGALQPCDVILSLMVPPVACTLLVVALNALLHRLRPGHALREGELVVFYGILSVATAMAAEWGYYITPLIYSYSLFANPTNKFETLILPFVPDFLFVKDPATIAEFKYGGHDLWHGSWRDPSTMGRRLALLGLIACLGLLAWMGAAIGLSAPFLPNNPSKLDRQESLPL
jgi:hypothetical protein